MREDRRRGAFRSDDFGHRVPQSFSPPRRQPRTPSTHSASLQHLNPFISLKTRARGGARRLCLFSNSRVNPSVFFFSLSLSFIRPRSIRSSKPCGFNNANYDDALGARDRKVIFLTRFLSVRRRKSGSCSRVPTIAAVGLLRTL